LEITSKIFEDRLQQGKSGIVINRNLGNMQQRPKAWDRQTEAYTYWRERGHCEWNGRLEGLKQTSFNMPDIQRNGSNKV